MSAIHIDYFSGAAADLKKGQRNVDNVLAALVKSPRVSTWDMDAAWLRNCLQRLTLDGLIVEDKSEPYPWLRFKVTAAGHEALKEKQASAVPELSAADRALAAGFAGEMEAGVKS